MRRFTSWIAALVLIAIASARAAADDDTLKFFLAKSDLVVMGKINNQPIGIVWESGLINYRCKFQITDDLKGDADLSGRVIELTIKLLETKLEDKHPLIKKNGECILFLKKAPPQNKPLWESADFFVRCATIEHSDGSFTQTTGC